MEPGKKLIFHVVPAEGSVTVENSSRRKEKAIVRQKDGAMRGPD